MIVGYSCTRTLGRKRVMVPDNMKAPPPMALLKRVCNGRINLNSKKSSLEALPLDILIKVLCGVDHEDLKQLCYVSKAIQEATLAAKELHFEYSTPKKKSFACHNPFDLEDVTWFEEIPVPNAPERKSKSRLSGRKLNGIPVALFAPMDGKEDH